MARGTFVVVDDRFRSFGAHVDQSVTQALFTAANEGARAAREKRPRKSPVTGQRYQTEDIQSKTMPQTPKRTAKGTEVTLVNRDYRGVWFELGTLGRRRRKLTKATLARRESTSGQARLAKTAGNPGVSGNRFLAAGMLETKKRFQRELDRLLQG